MKSFAFPSATGDDAGRWAPDGHGNGTHVPSESSQVKGPLKQQSRPSPLRIAVIGGGMTGAVCSRELVRLVGNSVRVTVFDQGRGLGGRTSHRRVASSEAYVLPTAAGAAYAFDHGCQFFRADSARFRSSLLQDWLQRNWAAPWTGMFGSLGQTPDAAASADFFGFPGRGPFYCGVGGMQTLPCALLDDARSRGVEVQAGVRVASTTMLSSGTWLLSGTSGTAAYHDTAEEEAAKASPDALGEFDIVIVTDVSASMPKWHRASAGIPEEMAARVRGRTRVVLFTALVAFESPLPLREAAFSASDDTLWFAARTSSKPGCGEAGAADCWTLVSTPKYAAAEVARVPMQDPVTGAFRPQEMPYLREAPCADLLAAFGRLLEVNGHSNALPLPKVVYMGGQRWGSAFPSPANIDGRDEVGRGPDTVTVCDVAYDSAASLPLVPSDDEKDTSVDFVEDDNSRIYYASDYVSTRLPGVEAAALSGLDVAQHVANIISSPVF